MSQVNQLTVHQHLEAAKSTVSWASHIPALQDWLKEKRTAFYYEYAAPSLSDLLSRFSWAEAPGGYEVWSRIFSEQHTQDNRDWWAYRLERIF